MKTFLQVALWLLVASALSAAPFTPDKRSSRSDSGTAAEAFDEAAAAQPKLLRISARCDGSGRIVFTRDRVHYEHKHWGRPHYVLFDGEPWNKLDRTPTPWRDFSHRLDLTKASIVKRHGRDIIALESTPDGFHLYLSDSPNGAADYSVTIAIPRRR